MQRRLTWRLSLLALALVFTLSGCGQHQFSGTVIEPPNDAADFTLTDQNGQPFRLSEQRGKVVLMYFGFTNCPDFCPSSMGKLATVQRELGTDAANVQVVFITADPERDTPERLQQYVTAFHPSFLGLRGTDAELEPILKAYGAYAKKVPLANSGLGYTVDHTTVLYAIDKAGKWRLIFPYGTTNADLLKDIRYLAQERVS
ncbi:MAG: SCO family protein [Chloroflexaceae bacterium]|nr:SCO family protein [Chloroflexaceae bacterium]